MTTLKSKNRLTPKAPKPPKSRQVTISLHRPEAREVYLCGDFNQWSPTSLPMLRHPANGRWEKCLTLPPGRYQYKFVADGQWLHNPEATENTPNPHGSFNSILEVPA